MGCPIKRVRKALRKAMQRERGIEAMRRMIIATPEDMQLAVIRGWLNERPGLCRKEGIQPVAD